MRLKRSCVTILLLLVMVMSFAARNAVAQAIGFAEQFAFAKDRAAVLKQLIPGTEDFYYYHCLHYQNLEQYAEVEKLLPIWTSRHGETERYHEMVTRHYLLSYPGNHAKSLDWIKQQLGLTFAHERPSIGEKPNLPEKLDPALISSEALSARAMSQHANLDGFEDRALDWLTKAPLDAARRRSLLERLSWPDYPNLTKLILEDMDTSPNTFFGGHAIHRQLLLSQLDEMLEVRPDLRDETAFAQVYLSKLAPNRDQDANADPVVRETYLDRLWAFAKTLSPLHNSLKAQVLYHRLVHDRALGKRSKERLLAYLALPRPMFYVNPTYLEAPERRNYSADLQFDASEFTSLRPIGNDEKLVRSYLMHFLVEAADTKEYEPFIESNYLKQVFAETKILAGLGDAEKWYSMLSPLQYQSLKDRVDLEFAHENKTQFGVADPVVIDLDVKNVKTLLVKVFEIRTGQFYRTLGTEIDTDINLDGLVPHEEKTVTYDLPPMRREKHRFEFPSIDKQGVYVIDFIGNGKSSRVLVRKGRLHPLVAPSPVGVQVVVLNEKQEHVKDATLWMEGATYKADEKGVIQVPFTTTEGTKTVVLSQGDFSSLAQVGLPGEAYDLKAAVYVDRESLRSRKPAKLAVRAQLLVNGNPVSLAMLNEAKLTITSIDLDGIANSKEVKAIKLSESQEYVYDFQTPPRLATLKVTLQGSVKSFLTSQPVPLSDSHSFDLNQIDRGSAVDDFHLLKTPSGYILECRGKTGELRPQIAFEITLKHKHFRDAVKISLKTNDAGRTELGELADISYFSVPTRAAGEGLSGARTWGLTSDQRLASDVIHAKSGDDIRVPYLGTATSVSREEFSLVQSTSGGLVSEHFAALSLEDGFVCAKKLTAGDYELRIKSTEEKFSIRIAAGEEKFGVVLGKVRQLQARDVKSPHVTSLKSINKAVIATVANPNATTRVHVIATRYQPSYSVLWYLGAISRPGLRAYYSPQGESAYIAGRTLSDEYRYILDRRQAKKYVGNMLERPSLLLNPWSIRKTATDKEKLADGKDFDAESAIVQEEGRGLGSAGGKSGGRSSGYRGEYANLDFLADGPLVALNLPVEKDGTVAIDRAALGEKQWVHVVLVDAEMTEYRQITLEETKQTILDLRLAKSLPADQAFSEQRKITLLQLGGAFEVADLSTAKIEPFDNLRSAFRLQQTLSKGNATLAEFGFVLDWPTLELEEKQAKYSQYACHELHFFLMKKDPEFFATVVKPFLANKKDKTFLDVYLLGADLTEFARPWNYARLNTVERILLAQRLTGELANTRLLLRDQVDMIPVNVALDAQRYKTAVYFGSLETQIDRVSQKNFSIKMYSVESATVPFGDEAPARFNNGGEFPASKDAVAGRPDIEVEDAPRSRESVVLDRRVMETEGRKLNVGLARLKSSTFMAQEALDLPAKLAEWELQSDRKKEAVRELAQKSGEIGNMQELLLKREAKEQEPGEFADGYARFDRQIIPPKPFIPLDNTEEWAESNYYKLRIADQVASLTPPNRFWRDYVHHDGKSPFLSQYFSDATSNFTEMIFALSVLDLPFESPKHEEKVDGLKYSLRAAGPMIIFHEGILPTATKAESSGVLVSQNLFRADDRHRMVDGVQVDKFITDEFLVHTVYGCQVVVTNPTSSNQRVDVLTQIPQGAMPVSLGQATRSTPLALGPYATQQIEYFFYFPLPGEEPHYGAQVSRDGMLLTSIASKVLNVVSQLKNFDRESWDYVSVYGSDDDVLAFLKTKNLQNIGLSRIAYRMKAAKFFDEAVAILASRHAFDATLWSYSVLHDSPEAMREYLRFQDPIVNRTGAFLNSPLLVVDPIERRTYEHLDYRPLINPRAHQLGPQRTILNDAFLAQYQKLLAVLTYKPNLSDAEKVSVIYYLLLQDRIEESLEVFAEVDKSKLAVHLQYDYFAAYLKMCESEPAAAKQIAAKFAEYPVDRLRSAFANITQQVNEIDGAAVQAVDDKSRDQTQAELAAKEPSLELKVEAKKVRLEHQNVTEITVNYYLMDLELLFSNNPFVKESSGQFSFVRPNLTKKLAFEMPSGATEFDLPEQFQQSNVLVEVEGGGKTESKAYYANSLTVQMLENYGQVRVTSPDQKPVAGAYVKVYSKGQDGAVRFFKDGYTDLRGRFDYASVSSNEVQEVAVFSMLISSEKFGAVVREVNPPRR